MVMVVAVMVVVSATACGTRDCSSVLGGSVMVVVVPVVVMVVGAAML